MCESRCYATIEVEGTTYVCRKAEHSPIKRHEAGNGLGDVLLTWDVAGLDKINKEAATAMLLAKMDELESVTAPIYEEMKSAIALIELAEKMHPAP